MQAPSAGRVGEHHLVLVSVQGPEPSLFHLTFPGFARFDRRLIHRQHLAAQYIIKLCLNDGPKQFNGSFSEVGQGGATERNTGALDALMLTVQRQVVLELIHQQPRQKADIGDAALEHIIRRRAGFGLLLVFVLEYWAVVLQYHVAGRTLGQTIHGFGGDHFVLIRLGAGQLRGLDVDNFYWDVIIEAQPAIIYAVVRALFLGGAALIGNGLLFTFGLYGLGAIAQIQAALERVLDGTFFRLLTEQLCLEPAHAVAQRRVFRFETLAFISQKLSRWCGAFHAGDYTSQDLKPHADNA